MDSADCAWYCVRSQPKHEHIAAASLRRLDGVDVFNPRLRVRRVLRRKPTWIVEALFPGYLFARFSLKPALEAVQHSFGVKTVVHFGDHRPTIDAAVIEELRERLGGTELIEHETELTPGEEVQIAEGPFMGLTAVVQRFMPAHQRVRVLLEFLGKPTPVELGVTAINLPRRQVPGFMLGEAAA